jgi:hypothetical protein
MANDIIDINVYETTETVAITVNPNLTTVNINQVTGGGGVTNLSTTQTASNFTINSDTGDDAIVPLGNGTLAGATLNDYTTAEKNKLVDTYTKSEVDTKITGVYKVKGSVANYAALPSSGQVIGDVWNLLDTGGNYVWTGTTWDELGATVDISGKANIDSPTFTGIPLAPTATAGTNNTQIATTAFTTTAIAGKMNNPSLTASYIPKALTATTIGNSRLLDTGTYLGIGTVNTPLKDVALGYQTNREIGVEQSDSTTIGRDLNISAGTTVNYSLNSDFVALNQSSSNWNGICGHVNNNVYAAVSSGANGGIYTQTVGVGNFTQTSIFTSPQVFAITCLPNGNIYVTTSIDIYKQTAATGSFVAQSSGLVTNATSKISSDINNNIYVIINSSSGLIYKKTNDAGSFVAMSITSRLYNSITCHPNGNIYATVLNGDIYMQTAGIGDFNPLSQTTRSWNALACTSNGNVYAQAGSLIYMQTAGTGNFILQSSLTSRAYTSLGADINGNVYATVGGGDVYKQINATIGTDNLKGGTLKLNSGTGKGTGASDIEMYTGQILASGTDMQTSTLRAKIDNTGLMTLPSVTNALIIADTTGKAVATKEYVASVAGGVPYTGATSDVNLGVNDIIAEKLIKSGGTSSQILAADGSVITAGNNITITGGQISSVGSAAGGGSSVNYYLNGGTSQGTFGGSTYYEFSKTAVIGTGADFNISSNGYIASFITDVADPSLLLIPAGNWNLEFFFSSSSAGGSPSFYTELYKYDGTTFTLIASNSTNPEGITNGTAIDAYFTPLAVPETILTVNDRLAIRVFVNASSKTITLHTQNGHLCEVITTFSSGLTALNGLQAQVQNFAVGTSGTDFAINSSGSTHTFNLPDASATVRGVVTTTTQTFAGDKTFTGAIGASNLSGTNTGDNATNTQYSGLAASKQDTITLTTTGTSGASTLVGATLNIPQYSGATNLGYTAAPTNGTVTSSTGSSATLPLADATNAGLLKPAKFTVLENTSGTNTGDQDLSGYALLASPTFTGTPSLPTGTIGVTQTAGDNSTKIATTAFVSTAVAAGGVTVSGQDTFGTANIATVTAAQYAAFVTAGTVSATTLYFITA